MIREGMSIEFRAFTVSLFILSAFVLFQAGFVNAEEKGGQLTDAMIIAIFDNANTADIVTGQLGVAKGNSEEVRALGKMVVTDHMAVQQMGRDLANKLGVFPDPPPGDQSIQQLAETVTMLQSKSGEEFDKAYLLHEIQFHQSVIDAINEVILPSTQNEELKALIIKVSPGFKGHLEATKAAARKLGYYEGD